MSKYEPLWHYIETNNVSILSFEKIKEILGFDIDHCFLTYKKELKEYGYDISKVYIDCGEKIFDNEKQGTFAGGSGCGCSAVVACGYLYRIGKSR